MRTVLITVLTSLFLTACSTTHDQTPTTFYDYTLLSPKAEFINIDKLPNSLINADVILVGEWHTHAGIHHFQTDLLQQLVKQHKDVTLSMEQFSRDKQPVVDEYLDGKIGEQPLIDSGNAWPNYESDYRPVVEFAKSNNLDIIASNAPNQIVRCIGRQGISYLDKLTDKERTFIANDIDTSTTPYKQKFMASMHHGKPEQTENQFAAQVTWDETMAESIVKYLANNPNSQVVHIAGKFHTELGLGIKAAILKRNPNLNIAVITPVPNIETTSGDDFRLVVVEPPVRYVQMENRMKAYQKLSERNMDLTCR